MPRACGAVVWSPSDGTGIPADVQTLSGYEDDGTRQADRSERSSRDGRGFDGRLPGEGVSGCRGACRRAHRPSRLWSTGFRHPAHSDNGPGPSPSGFKRRLPPTRPLALSLWGSAQFRCPPLPSRAYAATSPQLPRSPRCGTEDHTAGDTIRPPGVTPRGCPVARRGRPLGQRFHRHRGPWQADEQ